jgi:hypothetical protein
MLRYYTNMPKTDGSASMEDIRPILLAQLLTQTKRKIATTLPQDYRHYWKHDPKLLRDPEVMNTPGTILAYYTFVPFWSTNGMTFSVIVETQTIHCIVGDDMVRFAYHLKTGEDFSDAPGVIVRFIERALSGSIMLVYSMQDRFDVAVEVVVPLKRNSYRSVYCMVHDNYPLGHSKPNHVHILRNNLLPRTSLEFHDKDAYSPHRDEIFVRDIELVPEAPPTSNELRTYIQKQQGIHYYQIYICKKWAKKTWAVHGQKIGNLLIFSNFAAIVVALALKTSVDKISGAEVSYFDLLYQHHDLFWILLAPHVIVASFLLTKKYAWLKASAILLTWGYFLYYNDLYTNIDAVIDSTTYTIGSICFMYSMLTGVLYALGTLIIYTTKLDKILKRK